MPLLNGPGTLAQYNAWEQHQGKAAEQLPGHVKKAFDKAQDLVSKRRESEQAVAEGKAPDTDLLAAYMAYIQLEEVQAAHRNHLVRSLWHAEALALIKACMQCLLILLTHLHDTGCIMSAMQTIGGILSSTGPCSNPNCGISSMLVHQSYTATSLHLHFCIFQDVRLQCPNLLKVSGVQLGCSSSVFVNELWCMCLFRHMETPSGCNACMNVPWPSSR